MVPPGPIPRPHLANAIPRPRLAEIGPTETRHDQHELPALLDPTATTVVPWCMRRQLLHEPVQPKTKSPMIKSPKDSHRSWPTVPGTAIIVVHLLPTESLSSTCRRHVADMSPTRVNVPKSWPTLRVVATQKSPRHTQFISIITTRTNQPKRTGTLAKSFCV